MRKPTWRDAPEWAQYLAQDMDGTWCWYKSMPHLWEAGGVWEIDNVDDFAFVQWSPRQPNPQWTKTLQEKP